MYCFSQPKRRNLLVPTPNLKALSQETNFDVKELQYIFSRFESICDDSGVCYEEDFLRMPELSFSPLMSLVYQHIAQKTEKGTGKGTDGSVSFETFVHCLSVFSVKSTDQQKVQCKLRQRRFPPSQPQTQLTHF